MNGAAGGRAGEAKFTFSERGRGRIQRLDVTVSEAFLGSDGDGLPDWFEDQFAALGFDKNNPLDAAADFNGNGLSNLAEYTQGSDPAALAETYAAWAARRGLTGATALRTADPDADGTDNFAEFAVDCDPLLADREVLLARARGSIQRVGLADRLTITLQKPATPRVALAYRVEVSSNGVKWAGLEKKDLVTVYDDRSGLQRRDALRSTKVARRLMRLAAVSTDSAQPAASTVAVWGALNVPIRTRGQTLVGVPFGAAPAVSGEIDSASGATITDDAAAWTVGQWTTAPHAVQVLSGAGAGRIFPILANATQTLTLDATATEQALLATGASYEILPLRTLDTLFRAGAAVFLDRASSGESTWTQPLPF